MKKFLLALMIAGSIAAPTSAQEVTVEGVGLDRDGATRDAMRLAVEQVAGTYINADTIVSNLMVELDEVYKKSQGYVRSVKILKESKDVNGIRVRALVDVDNNPNGKLMSDLAMIYSLNDPRITVVVLQSGTGNGHSDSAETTMNERLLSMGFTHVVDAAQVIRQRNANVLREIYNESAPVSELAVKDNSVDYVVIGRLESYSDAVNLPNYRGGGTVAANFNGAFADLTCKVIKYDTGDIIGSFHAEGKAFDGMKPRAEILAIRSASTSAADQLSRSFKTLGAKMTVGIQMFVNASSYESVEQLRRDLLKVPGVETVRIREHSGNQAVIELDSTRKVNDIIQLLRQRTEFAITVEGISGSVVRLSIN